MFFILRMIFWLCVVALLLPAPAAKDHKSSSSDVTVETLANRAVSAASSYCTQNPQNCLAGLETARTLGDALANGVKPAATASGVVVAQQSIALPPPRPVIP